MENLLEKIQSTEDLRALDLTQLDQLCEEMRSVIIETVSDNGDIWHPIWVWWS